MLTKPAVEPDRKKSPSATSLGTVRLFSALIYARVSTCKYHTLFSCTLSIFFSSMLSDEPRYSEFSSHNSYFSDTPSVFIIFQGENKNTKPEHPDLTIYKNSGVMESTYAVQLMDLMLLLDLWARHHCLRLLELFLQPFRNPPDI